MLKRIPEKTVVPYNEKCTGCRICELVCAVRRFHVNNPKKAAIRVVNFEGNFSKLDIIVCRHCVDPPCIVACPVGALYKADDGRVMVNAKKCTKCRLCHRACYYKAVFFHPDVATAILCDLCDGNPRCVKFCPVKAVTFGRI